MGGGPGDKPASEPRVSSADPAGAASGRAGVCAAPAARKRKPLTAPTQQLRGGRRGPDPELNRPLPVMVSGPGVGSGAPRGASPAINSCGAGAGRWCRGFARAGPARSPELGQHFAPPQSDRGQRGSARAGPRWSCRVGCLYTLSCSSFLPFPGGGGDGQPGSSGDPMCDFSFGRKGWKTGRRAPEAGKLQASPAPSCTGDSLPVDGAGIPCPPQPSLDLSWWGEGKGAPGGLCTTLPPERRRVYRGSYRTSCPQGVHPIPPLVHP